MINTQQQRRISKDIILVNSVRKNNDQLAFSELHKRYKGEVFYRMLKLIGNYEDANEITNEAFARVYSGIHTYNKEYAFSTWINTIAKNIFIDRVRLKKNKVVHVWIDQDRAAENGNAWTYEVASKTPTPEEVLIKSEVKKQLHDCINLLTPSYKQVIDMRYFKNYSLKEISSQTNKPLGTIKVQIRRAKMKLREYMEAA